MDKKKLLTYDEMRDEVVMLVRDSVNLGPNPDALINSSTTLQLLDVLKHEVEHRIARANQEIDDHINKQFSIKVPRRYKDMTIEQVLNELIKENDND